MPLPTLQDFIDTWMKGLQVLVDYIAPDPGEDNSLLPFNLPYTLDTTVYCHMRVKDVTHDFDSLWWKGGGNQYMAYSYRVNLTNNVLRLMNLNYRGNEKSSPYDWSEFTSTELADIASARDALYTNDCLSIENNYPDDPIVLGYQNNTITTKPKYHAVENISVTYPVLDSPPHTQPIFNISVTDISGITDNQDGTISGGFGDIRLPAIMTSYPLIATFSNQSECQDLVARLNKPNNHVITTDDYKMYYGDNYIIYWIDPLKDVNYNNIYNTMVTAVGQMHTDHPDQPPLTVKTYEQNKNPEPEPPEPEIESDNQEDGGQYEHAKFTKVYACTNSELENLYNWMGGGAAGSSGTSPITVPDNFDPMERIVGLIGYPMEVPTSQTDETTFTFRNAANQTINTGWSTYKFWQMHNVIDFGTVDIPYWEDETNGVPFLDYSSTVEIYVPFCGVVGLDPQSVMGCTLSCKMYIDFMTGDCSAIVYTNYGGEGSQHPVAFVSGNCGSAEVVSANAFGAYQGAKAYASHKMSQAIIGGVKNLATSIIGGATTGFTRGAANPSGTGGSAGMKAGAIGSVIGGAMDLGVNLTLQNMDNQYAVQVAKNSLGTTISGDFGQSTSWHYMDKPYIKVTWPTPISKNLTLYGKTYGVPVHKSGTLSEYTGYTICNNVDVSGISGATASELATIKQFLETGVYIKEGGEG